MNGREPFGGDGDCGSILLYGTRPPFDLPPRPARGVGYFEFGPQTADSGDILQIRHVSGETPVTENGRIELLPGAYLALYTFGARTANSVISARIVPLADGAELRYSTSYAARMPSGLLAQTYGAVPLAGVSSLAFKLVSDTPARFESAHFTLALLYR